MNKKNVSKKKEFENFSKLAEEWWNPYGKYKILHKILPIRIEYILQNIGKDQIKGLNILDLGCGGGLTCEPLAKLGGNITGIDFIKKNIEIAKDHSIKSKLNINYIHGDLEFFDFKRKYDIILALEVLEHIDDWEILIKKIKNNLNSNGRLIISTINKTKFAKFFGIFVAENILNWVPKQTHNYDKLIKPDSLKKALIKNNMNIINVTGMNFNPLSKEWNLNKNIYPINYFCTAKII